MQKTLYFVLVLFFIGITSCHGQAKDKKALKSDNITKNHVELDTAYLANGCFWCTEAVYTRTKGVVDIVPGYTGGKTKNPTYKEVATGRTGHAEAIRILYDKSILSYEDLLIIFFGTHDPTQVNRQGPDVGTQYRSAIFYTTEKEKEIAESLIRDLNQLIYDGSIATEVTELDKFYLAEEYHHDFYKNNPNTPYSKHVTKPIIEEFQQNFPQYQKESN